MGRDTFILNWLRCGLRASSLARLGATGLVLLASLAVATGCGSDADAADGPKQVGFTTGRDPVGLVPKLIEKCNQKANGRYVIEPIWTPPTVDGQREQMIRRLAGKDPSMDIVTLDVVWTAEFSEADWLYDLTDRIEPIKADYIPAALETVKWRDKYWAIPVSTNVAMLYYRTDLVKQPPKSWEQLAEMAKQVTAKHPDMAGFVWQANSYEGLTVNAMEFILAAQGAVLSEDGSKAVLDENDGALHAFTFMRRLFTDGVSPKQVLTFQEEESRAMFQQGKAVFLRNWPYVYALASDPASGSAVVGKFDVAPLPPFEGRASAGVLGGANYGISRFSDAPTEAWEAAQCLASFESTKARMIQKGDMCALEACYTDADVKKAMPYVDVARKALDAASTRPVTPYYNDVTYALSRMGNNVAAGRVDPETAVKEVDRKVQLAVDGKGEI